MTIARLGSFAAAARSLHLAAPTVSLHISELETRLGARLLIRNRGLVTPSGIGTTLIARANSLLQSASEALHEVQRQIQGKSGTVRIGVSTGALAHKLPRALETIAAQHPGIEVQVAILTSQETLKKLPPFNA